MKISNSSVGRSSALAVAVWLGLHAASVNTGVRQWDDIEIKEIKDNVVDALGGVRNIQTARLGDNVKSVANELQSQIDLMSTKGQMLREVVGDILEWTDSQRVEYQTFRGDKCDPGSECGQIKDDLRGLLADMAALHEQFPELPDVGFRADDYAFEQLDVLPAILLFPLHRRWEHISPQLKNLRVELESAITELGPDAFSVAITVQADETTPPSRRADRQSRRDDRQTDRANAQRFCRTVIADSTPIRQIRLNQIVYVLTALSEDIQFIIELIPDEFGAALVGEGFSGVPPTASDMALGGSVVILNVLVKLIETRRDNAAICRSIPAP